MKVINIEYFMPFYGHQCTVRFFLNGFVCFEQKMTKTVGIIILIFMSASLPRIKTVQEMPASGQHVPKFRKLTLANQNQEERQASLKTLKTQRLKSLSRYSTAQEQRQYKNQKIHLNLIERKLLSGTYDDKKETGNELNSLKKKRDNIRVEVALKTREAERIKNSLVDIKREIEELLERKGEYDKKMEEIKQKNQEQMTKTENAEEYRSVLESMLSTRLSIKLNLTKRINDLKANISHLTSINKLLDTEMRQASERLFGRQTKLQALIDQVMRGRNQRNTLIVKHQDEVIRRKEDDQLQSQKSKQYMAELDHLERLNELKQFHEVYDKILGHYLVDKYCKSTLIRLHTKYEIYGYCYRKLSSYKSFQEDEPKTLVHRYFQHETEKKERQQKTAEYQKYIEELQQKNEKLKCDFLQIQSEQLQHSQLLSLSQQNLRNKEHLERISKLDQEQKQAEEKANKIRKIIVRLLNRLNKKGERRVNLNEAAQKNMETLTSVMLALATPKTP